MPMSATTSIGAIDENRSAARNERSSCDPWVMIFAGLGVEVAGAVEHAYGVLQVGFQPAGQLLSTWGGSRAGPTWAGAAAKPIARDMASQGAFVLSLARSDTMSRLSQTWLCSTAANGWLPQRKPLESARSPRAMRAR